METVQSIDLTARLTRRELTESKFKVILKFSYNGKILTESNALSEFHMVENVDYIVADVHLIQNELHDLPVPAFIMSAESYVLLRTAGVIE